MQSAPDNHSETDPNEVSFLITRRELAADTSLLSVEGDLDLASAPSLKRALAELQATGSRHVVVDLSRVASSTRRRSASSSARSAHRLRRRADRVDGAAERHAGRGVEADASSAGYCATCVICSGAGRSVIVAIARAASAGPPLAIRLSLPSPSAVEQQVGPRLEDHAVLVGLGEDRRDDALAEGAVERVVDRAGADRQPRRGVAVDVDIGREALRAGVADDVAQLPRPLSAAAATSVPDPLRDRRAVGTPSSETRYWVGPGLGVDRQVLRRLQVQRDAGDASDAVAQPRHDLVLVAVRRASDRSACCRCAASCCWPRRRRRTSSGSRPPGRAGSRARVACCSSTMRSYETSCAATTRACSWPVSCVGNRPFGMAM